MLWLGSSKNKSNNRLNIEMDGWGVFTVTPLFICACSSAGREIDF
jgi:hypothetical protein